MITITRLIQELQKFPDNSFCYAHEGRMRGVVIVNSMDDQLGYIIASVDDECETQTVINDR